MNRLIHLSLAMACAALASCASIPTDPGSAGTIGSVIDATGAQAPAPLAHTAVDEVAIVTLERGADALATAVDTFVTAHVVVPGTPRARTIQTGLRDLRAFLVTASAAQRAGNATSYADALRNAAIAVQAVTAALRSQ